MINIIKYSDLTEANNYVNILLKKIDHLTIQTIFYNDQIDLNAQVLQFNLFSDIKIIKIYDAFFLNKPELFEQNIECIRNFKLLNDVDIYLFVKDKILANAKFKELTKDFQVIEIKAITETRKKQIIDSLLKASNLKISSSMYTALITSLPCNYQIIENEIKKLNNLLLNDSLITDEQLLIKSICNYNDENIFKLLDNILIKKHNEVWGIFNDLIEKRQDAISIVNALSSQLFNIYFCLSLLKQNKPIDQIAELVEVQPYFINGYRIKFSKVSLSSLKKIINELYYLEINIKLNKVNDYLAIKAFIINALTY